MQVEIRGWIYRYQQKWMEKPIYQFTARDTPGEDDENTVYLKECTILAQIDDPDMIAARVAGIEAEQARVRVESESKCAELEEHKQTLLCLTMD